MHGQWLVPDEGHLLSPMVVGTFTVSITKPAPHEAQFAAPSAVQASPVAASPFSHVHTLDWISTQLGPWGSKPALHDMQICAPSVVQASPVAASPFSHVHARVTGLFIELYKEAASAALKYAL
jgi:hypothetical protein